MSSARLGPLVMYLIVLFMPPLHLAIWLLKSKARLIAITCRLSVLLDITDLFSQFSRLRRSAWLYAVFMPFSEDDFCESCIPERILVYCISPVASIP